MYAGDIILVHMPEEWPVRTALSIVQQQEAPCFHLSVEEDKPGTQRRSTSSVIQNSQDRGAKERNVTSGWGLGNTGSGHY